MHIISHSQLYIVISPYIITKYEMKMRLKEKNIDRNFNSQEFITVKKKIIPKDYSLQMCSSFLNVGKIITINKKKNVKSIYFNNILAFFN